MMQQLGELLRTVDAKKRLASTRNKSEGSFYQLAGGIEGCVNESRTTAIVLSLSAEAERLTTCAHTISLCISCVGHYDLHFFLFLPLQYILEQRSLYDLTDRAEKHGNMKPNVSRSPVSGSASISTYTTRSVWRLMVSSYMPIVYIHSFYCLA